MYNLKFVKEHKAIAYLNANVPQGKEEFLEMIGFFARTRLANYLCGSSHILQ